MQNKTKSTWGVLLVGAAAWIWLFSPTFKASIVGLYGKYEVTIYQDTGDVPHVFGETDPDAAYGLAYAHAEDDFDTIQNVLLATKGTLATVLGKDGAANDYMVHLLRIWESAKRSV